MRATAFSCILLLAAGCGGGSDGTGGSGVACITLGDGQLAGIPGQQIEIEARIVAIDRSAFDDLAIDLPLFTPMQQVGGGPLGAISNEGRDVVVRADVIGGPADVPYLVPDGYGGFLSIVNLNFLSPFAGSDVKVFMALPLEGNCITFDDRVADPIQGFAGGASLSPLANRDPDLHGRAIYQLLNPPGTNALLGEIAADARNKILAAPTIRTVSGQRMLVVVQDVLPQIGDLTPEFQDAIEDVVANPFGIFTGVTLDVRPLIEGNSVELDVRIGSQVVSFFRSVPAQVNGQSADVEIPVYQRSVARAFFPVPDGQTVVIGGILRDGQTEPDKGFPVLGDLPIVGSLFRQKTNDDQNLILIITPRIIGAN